MVLKVVSFDVWNTLLRLEVLYRCMARIVANTLRRDEGVVYSSIVKAYREAKGLRAKMERIRSKDFIKLSKEIMCKHLGISEKALPSVITRAFNEVKTDELLIEGVANVLNEIKSLGLKLVIVGNVMFWPSTYNRELLRRLDLEKYFNAQFYADELGLQKPERALFLMISKVMKVEPHEVLHVGDGIVEDLGGALASGFRAVLITKEVSDWIKVGDKIHFIPNITYLPRVVKYLLNLKR